MRKRYLGIGLSLFFIPFTLLSQTSDSTRNSISVQYDGYHFDKQFSSNWHIAGLEYKHKLGKTALLGRINIADRLNRTGCQGELEAYPVFSKRLYGYVGAGYSNQMPVFPTWRSGASLYYSLSGGWELEGGFRQLYFDRNIWLATAGVSKYAGSWLLNVRYFAGMDSAGTQSVFLLARRYFHNESDYLWIQGGKGVSPDGTKDIQLVTNYKLSSVNVTAGVCFTVSGHDQLSFAVGYSRDEYLKDVFGNQTSIHAGIKHRF